LQNGALLHQKSYPTVSSSGSQEILVAFSAGELGAGDRPRITSVCHCSSKVCEPGGLGSCACLAEGCGFATVYSVLESGTVTSGRCRHCFFQGWQAERRVICSHSPSNGSLWVRRQPRTRFLFSCSRYKLRSPTAGLETILSPGSVPAVHRSREKTRMGAERVFGTQGEQLAAQRNTACMDYLHQDVAVRATS
jgi:hypothetical protein